MKYVAQVATRKVDWSFLMAMMEIKAIVKLEKFLYQSTIHLVEDIFLRGMCVCYVPAHGNEAQVFGSD